AVSGSPGRKLAASVAPINPAPVTVRISGAAHDPDGFVDAAAAPVGTSASIAAARKRRRPTEVSDRPELARALAFAPMILEISPQPSDQERAAHEAALAPEAQDEEASPWADELLPQREDGPEA